MDFSKKVVVHASTHLGSVRTDRRGPAGRPGLRRELLLQHGGPRRKDGHGLAAGFSRQDRDRVGRRLRPDLADEPHQRHVHGPPAHGASLSDVADVQIEIYRVFPLDSDVRTSAPDIRTPHVPTRVNSPSDVEFDDRSAAADNLTFTPGIIRSSFTAANSVLNGIHPIPNFHTGGDGAVTGQEVQFNVIFSTAVLPARRSLLLRAPGAVSERRFLLALGAQADRPAGDVVPARLH